MVGLGELRVLTTRIPVVMLRFIDLLAEEASKLGISYKVAGQEVKLDSRADIARVGVLLFTLKVLVPELKSRGIDVEALWKRALKEEEEHGE